MCSIFDFPPIIISPFCWNCQIICKSSEKYKKFFLSLHNTQSNKTLILGLSAYSVRTEMPYPYLDSADLYLQVCLIIIESKGITGPMGRVITYKAFTIDAEPPLEYLTIESPGSAKCFSDRLRQEVPCKYPMGFCRELLTTKSTLCNFNRRT